ncbi:hypothetical protein WJX79_008752 [Trebouxia sp. C0005]
MHCALQPAGGITEAGPMNSGYHGSTALTQDMSKTGDSMSCAKAGFQSSTVKSLSAAILGSAPMRLNNNIASAALGTEGLATISEQEDAVGAGNAGRQGIQVLNRAAEQERGEGINGNPNLGGPSRALAPIVRHPVQAARSRPPPAAGIGRMPAQVELLIMIT